MKTSRITHEKEYQSAMDRIEQLLQVVDDNTSKDDPNLKELEDLSQAVNKYEKEHYNLGEPTLREVIELRMFEMKLKQKDLAEILETNSARISEYLRGKRDITMEMARKIRSKLDIDADIILNG